MRANVRSHEFVLLCEAGLTSVQIGIEALSTSLLSPPNAPDRRLDA